MSTSQPPKPTRFTDIRPNYVDQHGPVVVYIDEIEGLPKFMLASAAERFAEELLRAARDAKAGHYGGPVF